MEENFLGAENFQKNSTGIFVPGDKPEQTKPNHDARRQIMKQVKRYTRQQTRENARRQARLKEKNGKSS